MGTFPQMFFVRECGALLPEWLLMQVPGLGFLDSPIRFLSLLDREVVARRGREVVYDEPRFGEADDQFDDDEDGLSLEEYEERLAWEDANEIFAVEEEEKVEETAIPPATFPLELDSRPPAVLSFYIEGRVSAGSRTPFSIKGEDFLVDSGTVVSGELIIGTYAAIQGIIDEEGRAHATIIVTDEYRIQ